MHPENKPSWRDRLERRAKELFHEYMPDRYVEDEDGWADWMAEPCRILQQEFSNELMEETTVSQELIEQGLPSLEQLVANRESLSGALILMGASEANEAMEAMEAMEDMADMYVPIVDCIEGRVRIKTIGELTAEDFEIFLTEEFVLATEAMVRSMQWNNLPEQGEA